MSTFKERIARVTSHLQSSAPIAEETVAMWILTECRMIVAQELSGNYSLISPDQFKHKIIARMNTLTADLAD